jgi:ADP-ribose pyrophosphatase YjhB (NUDIX family)
MERSYGIILVNTYGMEPKYALVLQDNGLWSFPKGHTELNETAQVTAQRELLEETSVRDCRMTDVSFSDQYHFLREGVAVVKAVKYFLAYSSEAELRPKTPDVKAARWVTRGEALDLLTFHSTREILRNAHSYVMAHDPNQWM